MSELHDYDHHYDDFDHHGRHHHHRHHHHFPRPALLVWVQERIRHSHGHKQHPWQWRYRIYPLSSNMEINIMTDVTVGHTVVDTVTYLDKAGNPMLVPVVPDSPPVWSKIADDTVDTMVVSADGSTDTISAVAAGTDTVTVTVVVGGVTFTANQQLNISAEAQVLTSVGIDAVVA